MMTWHFPEVNEPAVRVGRSYMQRHYSIINFWGHSGFHMRSYDDFDDLVNSYNL